MLGLAAGTPKIGVMIEVPSAALTADLLAAESDFLTIGTNDLIQCCLAVDRADERVSHLYEPLHPAILRLLRHIRRAAARQRVPLSVCGEMASDPAVLALLIGMDHTLSMTPAAIGVRGRSSRSSTHTIAAIAARVRSLESEPRSSSFLRCADARRTLERH